VKISRKIRSEGHVACRKEREVRIGYWWENLRLKRLLGRSRHIWEDNLQMGLRQLIGKCELDSSGSRYTEVA
jgi:hypothetical protein